MGKKSIRKSQPEIQEIMWKIRKNVREGNFSRVSDLIGQVLKQENSNETKHILLEKIYGECIAPWVERTDNEVPMIKQYENMLLEFARYEQGQENTEKALKILESIKESENPKIRKKVKRQINLINLSKELSKGEDIDAGAIEKIVEDIERDADSRTYMELISSVFGKEFPIEKLNLGELEKYTSGNHRKPSDIDVPQTKRSYSEELQVENRMRFLKEELDIEPTIRFCDKGIFAGSILLEIKDTNLILVETIIKMYADGTYEPCNYGSATYILPKDQIFDLIRLQTKKILKTQLKSDKIKDIPPIQHRQNKWKSGIKKTIEQMKTVSKAQTIDTDEQVQDEGAEPTESTEQTEPTENQKKLKSKTILANNIKSNRKFLQDINTTLDGILTDEIIEQLTRRTASYSFESIYNNRLKKKIFESLELLDIPAEQMDTEAKKIFLVMKMMKEDMSRLKSKEGSKGGISEEDLTYLIEQYSCYYDDALAVLRTGMAQGLNYKQITDAMKNCIFIQDSGKVNQQGKPSSVNVPNETNQEETSQPENSSHTEPKTPGIKRLLEDMIKNGNGNPVIMKVAQKMLALLAEIDRLDEEQSKADSVLQTIIKEEEEAKQKARDRIAAQEAAQKRLEQAIEEAQEASALAEQATKAEEEASRKKQEIEKEQKKIADEKAAIQKKLDEFIEL